MLICVREREPRKETSRWLDEASLIKVLRCTIIIQTTFVQSEVKCLSKLNCCGDDVVGVLLPNLERIIINNDQYFSTFMIPKLDENERASRIFSLHFILVELSLIEILNEARRKNLRNEWKRKNQQSKKKNSSKDDWLFFADALGAFISFKGSFQKLCHNWNFESELQKFKTIYYAAG